MKNIVTTKVSVFCFVLMLALTTISIEAEETAGKPKLTGPPTTLLSYDHLYVGEDGETHFKTVTVDYKRFKYADNIPPIWAALNGKWNAQYVMLAGNSPGWDARPLHPPRHRQVFIVLTGITAFIASDGEVREYGPGQMILMEDNNSKGHGSFVPSKGNSMVAIIPLEDEK
jgi:hypothetical protein